MSNQANPIAKVQIEPKVYDVYTPTTVRVSVWPSQELAPGAVLEVQLPNSFYAFRITQSHTQHLQAEDPQAPHYVSVALADASDAVGGDGGGDAVGAFQVRVAPRELITDGDGGVRHGQRVYATATAAIPAGAEVLLTFHNMWSPWVANQEEYFLVAINGQVVEPWPTFWVKPGPATWQRLIVPSSARPGEPFRALLVTLDQYDNVSCSTYHQVSLAVEGGETLEEDISFQGRYETLVSLQEEGVHRLVAKGVLGDHPQADGIWTEGVVSNPIRITHEPMGPYWGDIHVHTHISMDAVGNEPYDYAKDVSGLDFAGVCDHANNELSAQWARIKEWARQHYAPGKFVTILGYEGGVDHKSYHHNVYYRDLSEDFQGITFTRGSAMPEAMLRANLAKHEALSQLHQSGTCSTDMREPYFPQTRLIEIYSHWGQSEYFNPDHALAYEMNRVEYPETRLTLSGRGPFYARDAWENGKRYVVIGSSDDHFAQAGKAHRGVAAVYSPALTRDGIFGGMKAGTCYATTGERILLDFRINGQPMASEVAAAPGDALSFQVEVYGTNVLSAVEVFGYRFGANAGWESIFYQGVPDRGLAGGTQRDLVTGWTETCQGPAVYYLRVRQKHLVRERPVYAWSTPIWVVTK